MNFAPPATVSTGVKLKSGFTNQNKPNKNYGSNKSFGQFYFENYVGAGSGFTEMAYQMSSHVLTLGYAVMLAALLYFVLTIKTVASEIQNFFCTVGCRYGFSIFAAPGSTTELDRSYDI